MNNTEKLSFGSPINENISLNNVTCVTFTGKHVSASKMTHSHVSNCYWYSNIFNGNTIFWQRILNERFNGIVLNYAPHPDFEQEHKDLMNLGLLHSTNHGYDIIFENRKIGEIRLL